MTDESKTSKTCFKKLGVLTAVKSISETDSGSEISIESIERQNRVGAEESSGRPLFFQISPTSYFGGFFLLFAVLTI